MPGNQSLRYPRGNASVLEIFTTEMINYVCRTKQTFVWASKQIKQGMNVWVGLG